MTKIKKTIENINEGIININNLTEDEKKEIFKYCSETYKLFDILYDSLKTIDKEKLNDHILEIESIIDEISELEDEDDICELHNRLVDLTDGFDVDKYLEVCKSAYNS